MSVKQLIETKAKFFSFMTYVERTSSFDMGQYSSENTGIYFIVYENNLTNTFDILKVGKADGERGLRSRLGKYRTRRRLPTRVVMSGSHKDKILSLYTFEIPMEKVLFEEYSVQTSFIRSFEKTLSIQARSEGHSMLLSGQD